VTTSGLTAFGKLPKAGDFIHLRVGGEAWRVFEDWLTQAVEFHEAQKSPAWKKACDDAEPRGFIYRPTRSARAKEVVVGVLWPSRDAVGRRFPFVLSTRLPEAEAAREPQLLPGALRVFFEQLATLTPRLAEWTSADDVEKDLAKIGPVALPDKRLADSYAEWTRGDWATFWNGLYGENAHTMNQVLTTLFEATRPFIRKEAPTTYLGFRLPLGAVPMASASFWIDLVRASVGWHSTVPSVFLPVGSAAGGTMLLQLGDPPLGALTEAAIANADSEHTCDLGPMSPSLSYFGTPFPVVGAMLNARTIAEVLELARAR
jgi:type VI secretion system ImpM family protein